jgi:hypothetical protein
MNNEQDVSIKVAVVLGCVMIAWSFAFLIYKVGRLSDNVKSLLDSQEVILRCTQQQVQQSGDMEFVDGAVSAGRVLATLAKQGVAYDKVTLAVLVAHAEKLRGTNHRWIADVKAKAEQARLSGVSSTNMATEVNTEAQP